MAQRMCLQNPRYIISKVIAGKVNLVPVVASPEICFLFTLLVFFFFFFKTKRKRNHDNLEMVGSLEEAASAGHSVSVSDLRP